VRVPERTITLAVEGDPVIEHRHPVSAPLTFADQNGPRLCLSTPRLRRRAPTRRLFGDPSQQSTDRGLELAESLLLETIGDRLNQESSADIAARRVSIQGQGLPALADIFETGI
jgi:hypothetical protein